MSVRFSWAVIMYPISRGKITSVSCIGLYLFEQIWCGVVVFFLFFFVGVKEGCLIRGKRGITFFGYPWLDRVMKNSRTRFIFLIYYNFAYTLLYNYLFIPYYISAISYLVLFTGKM